MGDRTEQDRRHFLKQAGVALLAVQCWPAAAKTTGNTTTAASGLIIRSTPGFFFHTHELIIPSAALRAPPPQGVRVVSTEALFHTHEFTLLREELITIGSGRSVTRRASSHRFVIALAAAARRNAAPQQPGRSL
jgi:hypothetical protein